MARGRVQYRHAFCSSSTVTVLRPSVGQTGGRWPSGHVERLSADGESAWVLGRRLARNRPKGLALFRGTKSGENRPIWCKILENRVVATERKSLLRKVFAASLHPTQLS